MDSKVELFLKYKLWYIITIERDVKIILCNWSSFHIIVLFKNLFKGTLNINDDNDIEELDDFMNYW